MSGRVLQLVQWVNTSVVVHLTISTATSSSTAGVRGRQAAALRAGAAGTGGSRGAEEAPGGAQEEGGGAQGGACARILCALIGCDG